MMQWEDIWKEFPSIQKSLKCKMASLLPRDAPSVRHFARLKISASDNQVSITHIVPGVREKSTEKSFVNDINHVEDTDNIRGIVLAY